jgi:hypothetical protein
MLWDMKYPLKVSCAYASSPAGGFNHQHEIRNECSDFMNGLVHGWINNLMALLEGGGCWDLIGGSRSLRV